MSSKGSFGELWSSDAQQGSPESFHSVQDSHEASPLDLLQNPGLPMQRYIDSYDNHEAFRSGFRSITSPSQGFFDTSKAPKSEATYYDGMYDNEIIEDSPERLLQNASEPSKDEQICEIVWAFEREREVVVYPARKPLPSGENATWDISNGEERTQPRRPPRRRTNLHLRRQRASEYSESSDRRQIQSGSQNSITLNNAQPYRQMPAWTEDGLALHHEPQQVSPTSDMMRSAISTTRNLLRHSSSCNRQDNFPSFNRLDPGTRRIPDMNPSPSPSSAASTSQPPLGLVQQVTQNLSRAPPDNFSNGSDYPSANDSTRGTRNNSSSSSNDTMTSSSGSHESPFSTPLSSSTSASRNTESSYSQELGFSPGSVEARDLAPRENSNILSSSARRERAEEDSDWFQAFIHDYESDSDDK